MRGRTRSFGASLPAQDQNGGFAYGWRLDAHQQIGGIEWKRARIVVTGERTLRTLLLQRFRLMQHVGSTVLRRKCAHRLDKTDAVIAGPVRDVDADPELIMSLTAASIPCNADDLITFPRCIIDETTILVGRAKII